VTDSCEHGNGFSGFIKGENFNLLSDCHLLKKDSVEYSYFKYEVGESHQIPSIFCFSFISKQ
jgi:hypothetical protein